MFKIALPKTEATKSVKIPIDTLHLLRNLMAAACSSTQESLPKTGESSRLDDIERQLKGIKACLAASALLPPPPPPQKHMYAAAVLATNTCPPSPSPIAFTSRCLPYTQPATLYNLTLSQKSYNRPALAELSNCELIEKIFKALHDADCHFKERPGSPDSDGNEVVDIHQPGIHAIGQHQSGDIWIAAVTEEG